MSKHNCQNSIPEKCGFGEIFLYNKVASKLNMDLYKSESEFIDSLDFLSPPVKRAQNSRLGFGGIYNSELGKTSFFHDHRNQLSNNTNKITEKGLRSNRNAKTRVESSTSLILKKTYERQVQGRDSVLSYTNLRVSHQNAPSKKTNNHQELENKPLIKVTVIPKSDQVATAKYLLRRRHTPKRVQSTLSNQENSVQTKNLYLVVAGRRKDKIYEIKTTGSATFSSDQTDYSTNKNDDLSIEGLSSVKQLIQSLDMGQNKKDKKDKSERQHAWLVNNGNNPYETDDNMSPTDLSDHKKSNRSRVRIYGQLGLTEDDRYVLRYGATVNDKPVSDFAQLTADVMSPDVVSPVGYNLSPDDNTEDRKDAGVQACYEQIDGPPLIFGKESQGTQVNFKVQVSTGRSRGAIRSSDKDIQCSCYNIADNKNPVNKSAEIVPKDCQSPLVIISVYPKPSREDVIKSENKTAGNSRHQSPQRAHVAQVQYTSKLKSDKTVTNKLEPKPTSSREKRNIDIKKDNRQRVASRTPSPIKKASKSKVQEKRVEPKATKTLVEKKSPDRYKAMRAIKNKILEKDKVRSVSPGTSKLTAPNARPAFSTQTTPRKPSPIRSQEKGTNTAHAMAKKMLVDSYTKKLTNEWKQRDSVPTKLDNSKVTVNIDGEHEYYNLLFDQGKLTTDLKIRKSIKDTGFQRDTSDKSHLSASLENLLLLPERDAGTKQMSTGLYNKPFVQMPMKERFSGITIRDSIEISHRREDKSYSNIKNTQTFYAGRPVEDDSEFLAPIKHYTGDDCSIVDPVERDKQIRVLLGVDRSKLITPNVLQAHSSERDEFPYQCFYRRECEKSQVTEYSLLKLCPCLKHGQKMKAKILRRNTCHCKQCCSDPDCNATVIIDNPKHEYDYKAIPVISEKDTSLNVHTSGYPNPVLKLSNIKAVPVINNDNAAPIHENVAKPTNKNFIPAINNNSGPKANDNVILVTNNNPKVVAINNTETATNTKLAYADAVTDNNCYCKLTNSSSQLFNNTYRTKCCYSTSAENVINIDNNNVDTENVDEENYAVPGNTENSIYQQLILNRNIQVFLQVEQFSKQKPIILSRQQYNKVKKTIQNTICNKSSREKRNERKKIVDKNRTSEVSVGEIKKKKITEIITFKEEGIQTEFPPCRKSTCRRAYNDQTPHKSTHARQQSAVRNYENKIYGDNFDLMQLHESSANDQSMASKRMPAQNNDSVDEYSRQSEGIPQHKSNRAYNDVSRQHFIPRGNRHQESIYYKNSCSECFGERKPRVEGIKLCKEQSTITKDINESRQRPHNKYNEMMEQRKVTSEHCNINGDLQRVTGGHQTLDGEYRSVCEIYHNVSEGQYKEIGLQHQKDREVHQRVKGIQVSEVNKQIIGQIDEFIETGERLQKYTMPNELTPKHGGHYDYYRGHTRENETDTMLSTKEYNIYSPQQEEQIHVELKHTGSGEVNSVSAQCSDGETPKNNDLSRDFDVNNEGEGTQTIMLFNAKDRSRLETNRTESNTKKTKSSMAMHYTSVAYMNQIDLSASDVTILSDSSVAHIHSFQTIFRGHRKSPTPNLGTSAYSLYSDEEHNVDKSAKFIMAPRDVKVNKKPFLMRLMSCLVMRSTRTSALKLPTVPIQDPLSVNSSIDSYHISTSLAAVEVSSSIYDTTASFYSNHTILPINSKIKRGFFNSVRGFLTNRRS